MVQSHAREAVGNKNIVFGGNPYFMPISANAAIHRRRQVRISRCGRALRLAHA